MTTESISTRGIRPWREGQHHVATISRKKSYHIVDAHGRKVAMTRSRHLMEAVIVAVNAYGPSELGRAL